MFDVKLCQNTTYSPGKLSSYKPDSELASIVGTNAVYVFWPDWEHCNEQYQILSFVCEV